VQSGIAFGYDIEMYQSVFYADMAQVQKRFGLRQRYEPVAGSLFDGKSCPRTRMANGTTHYILYREVIEAGEPMCILEHDAEVVGRLAKPRPGVIQVSSHQDHQLSRFEWDDCQRARKMRLHEKREMDWTDADGVVRHPLNGTNGTSGYIISPDAAQKMVDYIHETGVAFADRVRTEIIGDDLWLQKPQPVLCFHDRCKSHHQ
jgi:hypothetical protein